MASPRDIHERAFEFACRVVRLHRTISLKRGISPLASQLLRSGTGVGSNLEEAKAAQSRADFIAKARIALKEAREAHYWLRLFGAAEIVPMKRVTALVQEANEIVAILTTIVLKASTKKPALS
ncbi:MAG TPA: four helix bundle protein [Thermoanaerobaculia bacterium]|nr:four helix bundle protein [Thermoanaerobaculia bacterium]